MKKDFPKVFPSILSFDFGHLADEAKRIEEAGADGIHVDIMDGHFVPNLTLGPKALGAIRKACKLFLDVHIMIYNPFDSIETLAKAGANRITFHFEATEDVDDTLEFIRKCGLKAGLAFRPETPFSMIVPFLEKCDMVLLMTVNPGFGGQEFMDEVVDKIKLTREYVEKHSIRQGGRIDKEKKLPPFEIQVDGGINDKTAKICVEAGANLLVSGNYLFHQKNLKQAIESLKGK